MWPASEAIGVSAQPHLGELRVWTAGPIEIPLAVRVLVLERQLLQLEARLAVVEARLARPPWWRRAWQAFVREPVAAWVWLTRGGRR